MENPGDRLGIDFISVFGLPPVSFVHLAADLGCRHISMALSPMNANPHHYPAWSLRDDRALRRQVVAALRERGVSISLGEGFLVRPGTDVRQQSGDLDTMGELGVGRVNILSIDPDRARSFDQLALFAALANERGIETTLEFLPGLVIGDLASAVAAAHHVGRPSFRLLIDAMHFFRAGSLLADLAALNPEQIGYCQLCDVPLVSKYASYAEEARDNRLPPGRGELDLPGLLAAIPACVIVGLEVPMADAALAGAGPEIRLASCIETARELLHARRR